jgi:hypothetical protein
MVQKRVNFGIPLVLVLGSDSLCLQEVMQQLYLENSCELLFINYELPPKKMAP